METYDRGKFDWRGFGRALMSSIRLSDVFQPGPIRSSAKSLAVGIEGALEAGGKKRPTSVSVNYLNSRFDVMS